MAIFSQRPRGYKCGMILVLVAFKLALFGVIAPGWWAQDMLLGSRSFRGLWLACSYVYSDCVVMDFSTFSTPLFNAARVIAAIGLVSLFVAYILLIVYNCCTNVVYRLRGAMYFSIKGGATLFISCMLFVGENNNATIEIPWAHYGPSFIVTLVASFLALRGGTLVIINNQTMMSSPPGGVGVAVGGFNGIQITTQQQQQNQLVNHNYAVPAGLQPQSDPYVYHMSGGVQVANSVNYGYPLVPAASGKS